MKHECGCVICNMCGRPTSKQVGCSIHELQDLVVVGFNEEDKNLCKKCEKESALNYLANKGVF